MGSADFLLSVSNIPTMESGRHTHQCLSAQSIIGLQEQTCSSPRKQKTWRAWRNVVSNLAQGQAAGEMVLFDMTGVPHRATIDNTV